MKGIVMKNPTRKGIVFGGYSVGPGSCIKLSFEELEDNKGGYAKQLFERLLVVDERSDKSKKIDKGRKARTVLTKTVKNVKKWVEKPGKYDLEGVDA